MKHQPAPHPSVEPSSEIKRSRRRSLQSKEEFRTELVARAKAIYREKGAEALSIRALTGNFGMSPMSFYGYFASKQELVLHIWTDFFSELLDKQLGAGRGRRSPLQVLEAHMDIMIEYWESHPDNYRMVYLPNPLADGNGVVDFNSHPIHQRLVALLRERVMACAHGKPMSEKALRLAMDLMFAKSIGYLHVTLAVGRYQWSDRARVRRMVIGDIVETTARACLAQ